METVVVSCGPHQLEAVHFGTYWAQRVLNVGSFAVGRMQSCQGWRHGGKIPDVAACSEICPPIGHVVTSSMLSNETALHEHRISRKWLIETEWKCAGTASTCGSRNGGSYCMAWEVEINLCERGCGSFYDVLPPDLYMREGCDWRSAEVGEDRSEQGCYDDKRHEFNSKAAWPFARVVKVALILWCLKLRIGRFPLFKRVDGTGMDMIRPFAVGSILGFIFNQGLKLGTGLLQFYIMMSGLGQCRSNRH